MCEIEIKDRWGVVELFGHVTLAGRLSEVEQFGTNMLRIEVPIGDGFVAKDQGPASIYGITWTGEKEARIVAEEHPPGILSPYQLDRHLSDDDVMALVRQHHRKLRDRIILEGERLKREDEQGTAIPVREWDTTCEDCGGPLDECACDDEEP